MHELWCEKNFTRKINIQGRNRLRRLGYYCIARVGTTCCQRRLDDESIWLFQRLLLIPSSILTIEETLIWLCHLHQLLHQVNGVQAAQAVQQPIRVYLSQQLSIQRNRFDGDETWSTTSHREKSKKVTIHFMDKILQHYRYIITVQ